MTRPLHPFSAVGILALMTAVAIPSAERFGAWIAILPVVLFGLVCLMLGALSARKGQ